MAIESTPGILKDHYDPRSKTLSLTQDVYYSPSVAAAGVAAHEAGHALQDAEDYFPIARDRFHRRRREDCGLARSIYCGTWLVSCRHRVRLRYLDQVERYAGKTRIIAELQTLVGDDPASPLQLSEEFIGNAACKAKEGDSNVLQVNGISLHVEDHGIGKPVLLLHGWPDSSYLWRNQIPFLIANGFRAIAVDLRGFGRSDRPEGVAAYSLKNAVADAVGIFDARGIDAADIVAHDWGAGVAWLTATAYPNRVRRLVVLSVPHPLAPYTLRQREMAWYQLFFQFEGIAETWLQHDNWALFREMLRGNGDIDRYISDLSRPDALKASLNWYRANLAPRLPKSPPKLPPVEAPTLGIWSSNDHYLDGERMKISGRFVKGPWRYEQIDDASHWIPLDAPDRLNQLLLEWLVD